MCIYCVKAHDARQHKRQSLATQLRFATQSLGNNILEQYLAYISPPWIYSTALSPSLWLPLTLDSTPIFTLCLPLYSSFPLHRSSTNVFWEWRKIWNCLFRSVMDVEMTERVRRYIFYLMVLIHLPDSKSPYLWWTAVLIRLNLM